MFQRNKKTVEGTMNIMAAKEASERWNTAERWMQKLCEEGRIESWQVLDDFQEGAEVC